MLSPLLAAVALAQAVPAAALAAPRGTVAVERPAATGRRPAPTTVFAEAVEAALIDAGFTAIPDVGHARHVARIAVSRTAHGAVTAKAGSGGGPSAAGGTLGASVGAGLTVGLPSNKTRVGELVATELTLSITRRGEARPMWEGRAITHQIAGTRADDPAVVARKLAEGLARNFDARSGLLISIP